MDVRIKENGLKFKYRVSGIIINDNKILLEKYSDKGWCLPGGYVMMGETSEKAMLRELNEFFTNFRDDKTHAIEFYYKVSFKDINDIDSTHYNRVEDDHGFIINHHFKWFTLEELKTINLLPNIVKEDILDNKEFFHHIISEL